MKQFGGDFETHDFEAFSGFVSFCDEKTAMISVQQALHLILVFGQQDSIRLQAVHYIQ